MKLTNPLRALFAAVLIACAPIAALAQATPAQPAAADATAQPGADAKAAPAPAAATPQPPAGAGTGPEKEVIDNPYGLEALWKGGDFVSKGTLIILVIMSMGSWYIMFVKLYEQQKLYRQARIVQTEFWQAGSVNEGMTRLKEGTAFRYIAESGIKSQTHHEGKLLEQVDLNTWVTMSIQRAVENVASRLQDGLAFLATVGSTAPFVGLFGTVFGIINAFTGMKSAESAGIGAVAGGIAEALLTTALGLAVAVPAVWLFNYFTGKVDGFIIEMDNSASELIDYFLKNRTRQLRS